MKTKFPRAAALDVARELCAALKPATERLIVAGSLRRRKAEVGDVEILYIPKRGMFTPPGEIFARMCNVATLELDHLLGNGTLTKRLSKTGTEAWGEKNKLAVHRSGVPVDLFAATEENWWNYLVCRTGPGESNIAICNAAIARGWKWNPYGSGFSRGGFFAGEKNEHAVTSEAEVFEFVGLPYLPPEKRG